jgi:hypothetical protein
LADSPKKLWTILEHLLTAPVYYFTNMNMNDRKHTHRGTCQVCGRTQAAMIKQGYVSKSLGNFELVSYNVLAKHGYTVDWGFFHGVCMGSENKPLEHDKTLTERIIKELREDVAPRADKRAADLESGAVEPKWYRREHTFGKTTKVAVKRDELSDYDAKQQIAAAIYTAQSEARGARAHADMLEKLMESRFGQPLIPVEREARKELAVGSRVQIGGKKGIICEVVEIKDQEARGCGPYMNGKVMPHAILKRPDGRLIAEPTRLIRQAAILTPGGEPSNAGQGYFG